MCASQSEQLAAVDADTTIAIITFNSAGYIRDCLASVQSAVLVDTPVLVIDNGSCDGTAEIVRHEFPDCKLVVLSDNTGHSAACNLALEQATTTWVLLLDHDTTVPAAWLQPLLTTAQRHWPRTAMVSSRAVFPHQQRIHHDGGWAHFVGHMTLQHGFAPLDDGGMSRTATEVGAQATTSLLVHRARALAVGGFDPHFFVYLNDFELSLRLRLRGWGCYVEPQSIVYHYQGNRDTSWRGQGSYPARRAYLIYRNRWLLILKLYAARTLVVCAPALVLYEAILLAAALRKGWLRVYVRALREIVRLWPVLRAERRLIQQSRILSDRQLLSAHGLSFVPGLVQKRWARLAQVVIERIFAGYWRCVGPLLGE